MKKMKTKVLTTVLAIVTAAALAGCAADETRNAKATDKAEVSAHETTAEKEPAEAFAGAANAADADKYDQPGESEVDVAKLSGEQAGESEGDSDNDPGENEDPEDNEDDEDDEDECSNDEDDDSDSEDEDGDEDDDGDDDDDDGSGEGEAVEITGKLSPIDNGTYPCSVVLVSTAENTTKEMIQEVVSKYNLGIVYDYGMLNMYAFSVPEPMDKETTKKFLDELMSYEFIVEAEPDQIIYLDDPVIRDPGIQGSIQ